MRYGTHEPKKVRGRLKPVDNKRKLLCQTEDTEKFVQMDKETEEKQVGQTSE